MVSDFKVRYIDLPQEFKKYEQRLTDRFRNICSRGEYIMRSELTELESVCANYLNVKYAIGVGSGSDALLLSLLALGISSDDEVITVSHTFVATLSAIHYCGAMPVLVDISEDHNMDVNLLESAITSRTKAVIPVHMNGHACEMNAIRDMCKRYDLSIVEDAAQAFGTKYYSESVGALGDIACFSFHPMKVFHALGDAGLVTTNDDDLAEKIRLLQNHGQKTKEDIVCYGFNSRLDNLQAGFLLEYFNDFSLWVDRRREIALQYQQSFEKIDRIALPIQLDNAHFDIFSSYVLEVKDRDALKEFLLAAGIEVFIHWDPPLHTQHKLVMKKNELPRTEKLSRCVLSLPIHPQLLDSQVKYVINKVKDFYGR